MAGFHAQCRLDMLHKGAEKIQEGAVRVAYGLRHLRVHQGAEHQGWLVLLFSAAIDASRSVGRLLGAVDKGYSDGFEFNLLELGQHRIAEGFSGNARAVGHDKHGTFDKSGGHEVKLSNSAGP